MNSVVRRASHIQTNATKLKMTKHTAEATQDLLKTNKWSILKRPSRWSDLNPVEHVQKLLQTKTEGRTAHKQDWRLTPHNFIQAKNKWVNKAPSPNFDQTLTVLFRILRGGVREQKNHINLRTFLSALEGRPRNYICKLLHLQTAFKVNGSWHRKRPVLVRNYCIT